MLCDNAQIGLCCHPLARGLGVAEARSKRCSTATAGFKAKGRRQIGEYKGALKQLKGSESVPALLTPPLTVALYSTSRSSEFADISPLLLIPWLNMETLSTRMSSLSDQEIVPLLAMPPETQIGRRP